MQKPRNRGYNNVMKRILCARNFTFNSNFPIASEDSSQNVTTIAVVVETLITDVIVLSLGFKNIKMWIWGVVLRYN